jgi:hypothetical protein
LDQPAFEPVLARAERLGAPLYIHPGVPPESVRAAYYDGLPGEASFLLSIAAGAGTPKLRSMCCAWRCRAHWTATLV